MRKFLESYKRLKPFTDDEAWFLFKLAAWGEAAGWTILITGILLGHILKTNLPVLIAGQFHGLLFLTYMVSTLAVSPSMSWRFKKILAAILCGVPPYGSLVFEFFQAGKNNSRKLKVMMHSLYLRNLSAAD